MFQENDHDQRSYHNDFEPTPQDASDPSSDGDECAPGGYNEDLLPFVL